jgi:hypothetical protein
LVQEVQEATCIVITLLQDIQSSTLPSLAAGSIFYVCDNKECQNSVPVTITQPANALTANVVVPFSCSPTNANVSGTVTINVTAGTGTAPYNYSFNGGALPASMY